MATAIERTGRNPHTNKVADEALYRSQLPSSAAQTPPVQIRYVASSGSDGTGNGSFAQPFATVSHALSTITDAAVGKPYVILVSPGTFAGDIALKSFVGIKGVDPSDKPVFTGTLSIDPGFTAGGKAALSDLIFTLAQTLDFSAFASPPVSIVDVQFQGTFSLTGTSVTSIRSNRFVNDTHFTDNATLLTQDNTFVSSDGGATFEAATVDVVWLSNGDDFGSALNVTAVGPQTLNAQLVGSQIGGPNTLTLDGAGVTFGGTAGAIAPTVALAGGAAAPSLWTQGNSIGYSAHTPGNWAGSAPGAVSDQNTLANSAIDRLAAAVEGLLGHAIP